MSPTVEVLAILLTPKDAVTYMSEMSCKNLRTAC